MNQLYVANLADGVSEAQLHKLFGEYGEVLEITFHQDAFQKNNEVKEIFPYALVTMGSEKSATKAINNLNGCMLQGQRLAVSLAEAIVKPLMPKQRQSLEEIARMLNETQEKPLRMLEAMVILCGVAFARAIAEEAIALNASGGLTRIDSNERRTVGGIFFYLARFRMSKAVRKIVYTRKGRFPVTPLETDEAQAVG